jgi:hypothetical protein
MKKYDFQKDLKEGEDLERLIIAHFPDFGFRKEIHEKFRHYYDLVDHNNVRYEVKKDVMSIDTGNVFFECFCNKRRSGILKTTAEVLFYAWQQEDRWVIYRIPTHDLLRAIISNALNLVIGGENNLSEGVLIRRNILVTLPFVSKFGEIREESSLCLKAEC